MRDDLKKKIELAHKRLSELENSGVGDLYDVRDTLWSITNPIVTQPPSTAELAETVADLYPYTSEQRGSFDNIRTNRAHTEEYRHKLITAAKLQLACKDPSIVVDTGYNQLMSQCLRALASAALLDAAGQAAKDTYHKGLEHKPDSDLHKAFLVAATGKKNG